MKQGSGEFPMHPIEDERLSSADEDRERIIGVLVLEGVLRGRELIAKQKPRHGNCCTCQDCGWAHDECVCSHNEILSKIMSRRCLARS